MSEIELKARELLADELDDYSAKLLEEGLGFTVSTRQAMNAIASALAPQWQPIESAPKTTRSILVWCPERQNQYMVSWDDRYEEGEWRTVGGWTALTEEPTAWQPLPAAPEVE